MGLRVRVMGLDRAVFGDGPSPSPGQRSAMVPILVAGALWTLAVVAAEVTGRSFELPDWVPLLIGLLGIGVGTAVGVFLLSRRR